MSESAQAEMSVGVANGVRLSSLQVLAWRAAVLQRGGRILRYALVRIAPTAVGRAAAAVRLPVPRPRASSLGGRHPLAGVRRRWGADASREMSVPCVLPSACASPARGRPFDHPG